jgi:hypothetical protein
MGLPLDLAIEEDTGMTLVMPFRQLPIYLSIPSVTRERNAVYDAKLTLAERYQELSASMLGARSGDAVHDLDQLALPPIALQTLSRASTFDELGEVTLEQRSRYEPIRKRFREVREIFASEHYGWRERYAKKAKLDADMKRLSGTVRYVPTLTEFVGDAEKIAEALAPMMITHDFSKGGKLIPPFAKWFDDRLFKFRVRPLVGLVEFYTDASVREIATASRVLFRHELTSADVERARSYVASVGKYVPKRRHTSSPDSAQTVKPPKNE